MYMGSSTFQNFILSLSPIFIYSYLTVKKDLEQTLPWALLGCNMSLTRMMQAVAVPKSEESEKSSCLLFGKKLRLE